MNVAFRVDGSIEIGSGHVMRCLTLADALSENGCKCMFVSRRFPGDLVKEIRRRGYTVTGLPSVESKVNKPGDSPGDLPAHAEWLGVDWAADVHQTSAALSGLEIDQLVVDSYALDERWEQKLRHHCQSIVVIDDLADRGHDCDLLIDQNYFKNGTTRYDDLVPKDCVKLLGPQYALLRPEFHALHNTARPSDGVVNRVLVFFGGTDPHGLTRIVLSELDNETPGRFYVDVVVGRANPNISELRQYVDECPNIHLHVQTPHMAQLLDCCDLAIGAGGVNTWERLALGVPSLVITVAENQEAFSRDLHEAGALALVGRVETVTKVEIRKAVSYALCHPETLRSQSLEGMRLVDGDGTRRVVESILKRPVDTAPLMEQQH